MYKYFVSYMLIGGSNQITGMIEITINKIISDMKDVKGVSETIRKVNNNITGDPTVIILNIIPFPILSEKIEE